MSASTLLRSTKQMKAESSTLRMSGSKLLRSTKKIKVESSPLNKTVLVDQKLGVDISSDVKGIFSALQLLKEKSQKNGQKKNEEIISSVASDVKSMMDELKTKIEKDRQNFEKVLLKCTNKCEECLKAETSKFQECYEKFCRDKDAILQAMKDILSRFEENKENLFLRYEQQRKKEKNLISEKEQACAEMIANLEMALKNTKKEDKAFSILKKTLSTLLETGSDHDFQPED